MKQHELFSYVYDFVSQIMDNQLLFEAIESIIIFGSVARGDFTEKSDVDLFVEVKALKNKERISELVKKEINIFETRCETTWFLRGVTLPLKVMVGKLAQDVWKDLREEILSYGRLMYGKFRELPGKLEHQVLLSYDMKHLSPSKKMSFLREMYGYQQKRGKKTYIQKGLWDEIVGKRMGANTLLLRAEDFLKVKKTLKKFKSTYRLVDVWSVQPAAI